MSCIATFYHFPLDVYDLVHDAIANDVRMVERDETRKFLGYSWKVPTVVQEGEPAHVVLDEACTRHFELGTSGYLVIDYLWDYLGLKPNELFVPLDDEYYELSQPDASVLTELLKSNPPDEKALAHYLKGQRKSGHPNHYAGRVQNFVLTHETLQGWLTGIDDSHFGILWLTY